MLSADVVIAHPDEEALDDLKQAAFGLSVIVRWTERAYHAVGIVETEQPRLVLVGHRFPEMEIATFVSLVRRLSPGTRVVVCTGDTSHPVRGATLLRMPMKVTALRAWIEEFLAETPAREERTGVQAPAARTEESETSAHP